MLIFSPITIISDTAVITAYDYLAPLLFNGTDYFVVNRESGSPHGLLKNATGDSWSAADVTTRYAQDGTIDLSGGFYIDTQVKIPDLPSYRLEAYDIDLVAGTWSVYLLHNKNDGTADVWYGSESEVLTLTAENTELAYTTPTTNYIITETPDLPSTAYVTLNASMTSDTTPSGIVSYSSQYNTGNLAAWHAFDGLRDNKSWCAYTNTVPQEIVYDFGKSVILKEYNLSPQAEQAAGAMIKDWIIYGWNGSEYVTLHTVTGATGWTDPETRLFTLHDNTVSCTKLKMVISAVNIAAYKVHIGELEYRGIVV